MTPNPQTRLIDKYILAALWGISQDRAAAILAKACELKQIHGQEFVGGLKYEVTQKWLEENHV